MATNIFFSTPAVPDALPSRPESTRLRAVVVDDWPDFLRTTVELLELDGNIEVVATGNDGQQAISAVRVYDPDLVVMDVNMPRMNGLAATLSIRDFGSNAKVMIMSSDDSHETRAAAFDAGADAFVPKSAMLQHCRLYLRRLFPSVYSEIQ